MLINFWSVSFLLGSAQAGFLALALLLYRKRQACRANIYLGFFLLVFSLDLLDGLLFELGYYAKYPELIALFTPGVFLYGPLIYFYVSYLVNKQYLSLIPHLVPAGIIILILLPFYLLEPQLKLGIAEHGLTSDLPLLIIICISLTLISSIIHPAIYLLLSIKLLSKHSKNIEENFSYKEKINLNWLRIILLTIVLLWVFHVINVLFGDIGGLPIERLSYLGIVIIIYIMGILGLRQPEIFSETIPTVSNNTKYEKSSLSPEQALQFAREIEDKMLKNKYYLDNELTLQKLATELGLTSHYLSQIINEQFQKNFFEYINLYRIEYAKQQLSQNKTNILQLALSSGFNSKSAFYTAFKKYTGFSPTEFRTKNKDSATKYTKAEKIEINK